MSLKVIGAGFGRTGTTSLQAALERLGFGPCYHMGEVFSQPEHIPLWLAAHRGEPVDWERLFGSYRAAVDWPTCTFYRELMRRYPEARVLLTVRNPERWYESALNTVYTAQRQRPPASWLFAAIPQVRRFVGLADTLVWEGTFGGAFEDKAHAIRVFNAHIEEVKRAVPPERLLVFDVSEGWEPLCAFLGVPVPDEPFPRLNDAAAFREQASWRFFARVLRRQPNLRRARKSA